MLYLITPTQDRLLSFSFCVEFMQRQSYSGDVTWIICDSGQTHVPTPFIKNWTIVHKKLDYVGINTQKSNILSGLKECDFNHKTIFIEDDDFYHSAWLSIVSYRLEKYELVGEKRAKYYHLNTRTFQRNKNKRHSSLCSTGISGNNAHKQLKSICSTDDMSFIDINLWNQFCGPKKLGRSSLVIGMKGLYGKNALGHGHLGLRYKDTDNYTKLRNWIGDEWTDKYIKYFV